MYVSHYRKGEVGSYNRLRVFESQISNGRKIFRLLLWLNEVDAIYQLIINEKMIISLKVLKVISSCCSFLYYFTDNIVWFSKIGFFGKYVPFSRKQYKWGKIKDMFSLLKTCLELFIFCYSYRLKQAEEIVLFEKLCNCNDDVITTNSKSYVYLRKFVILRREMRYIRIEILIYFLRYILLTKHLKLGVVHLYLNTIFVSCCGLAMAITTVIKAIKSKKNFFKLELDDIKPRGAEELEMEPEANDKKQQPGQVLFSQAEILNIKKKKQFEELIKQKANNQRKEIKKTFFELKVPNSIVTAELH